MIVRWDRRWTPLGVAMLLLAMLPLVLLFHRSAANMEQMQQSTVRLLCKTKGGLESGSGFIIGMDRVTYVVTNDHVATCAKSGDAQGLAVILSRHNFVPAHIVWADADKDLAIVRTGKPLDRPAAQLADTSSVEPGAPVTVVGFPGAADEMVDTEDIAVPSVSRGNVSRVIPGTNGAHYFQHTAATNPGNSGGPVYDEAGHVIGINSLKALTLVPTISGRGQLSTDRVANGEGIAAAIDVAELLPHLRALGVPFVIAGTLTSMDIAMTLVSGAFSLLLAAGGILALTSSGREWLFRRAAPAANSRSPSARAGRIRILTGALAGMEVSVSSGIILGRDPSKAQIVFPNDDTSVSRQHCEIRFDSTAALFEVRDLGSRNGTFIANGSEAPRRLAANAVERVAPGQNILVGSSRNRLAVELS